MIKNIQKIIYEKNNALSIKEWIELDVEKSKLKYKKNNKKIKIDNISNELIIKYLDQLLRTIDGWKKEYINQNCLDGMIWKLTVIYRNGEKIEYIGKNEFPYNFEHLEKIEYQLINKIMEKK